MITYIDGVRNINNQRHRYRQRIARRKQKVQRLINEQNARRAALNSVTFLRRQDYWRAVHKIQARLYQLRRELQALDAGLLTGLGAGEMPEE